jgi:hypothetical protein
MKRTTITIALALAACDPRSTATPTPDRVGEAPEHDDVELLEADPPTRLPGVDPCETYGAAPGIRLTSDTDYPGEVLVPDWCIGSIPNVLGCWADHTSDGGDAGYELTLVHLFCAFDCEGEAVERHTIAGFPESGSEVVVSFPNPCPVPP